MTYRCIALLITLGCTQLDPDEDTFFSLSYWYCLGDSQPMAERSPARVQYVVPVVDFDSQPTAPTAVPGLQTKVCTNASCVPEYPRCGSELGQCYRLSPGPAPYVFVLDFPYAFSNGVLRFSAPNYADTDYVLGGPMIGTPQGDMTVQGFAVTLVPLTTRQSIYSQIGLPAVDPARGVLAVRALDCRGERTPGVKIQPWVGDVEAPAVAFSLSNNNLVTPTTLETDDRGVAGFINLAPQNIDVVAITPGGETFVRPTTVNIRPNVITIAELRIGLGQWGQ